jgi:hypothetical protein
MKFEIVMAAGLYDPATKAKFKIDQSVCNNNV